jgi:hypothetical protein
MCMVYMAVPPLPRPCPGDPVPGLVVARVLMPCGNGLPQWYEPVLVEAFMTPGTGHQLITAGRVRATPPDCTLIDA